MFVRLLRKVAMQNDVDFVDVIMLYIPHIIICIILPLRFATCHVR